MEQRFENAIDNFLNIVFGSTSSHILNGVGSIVIIVLGIVLMLQKSSSTKKVKKNIGLLCAGVGILSLISNVILILF